MSVSDIIPYQGKLIFADQWLDVGPYKAGHDTLRSAGRIESSHHWQRFTSTWETELQLTSLVECRDARNLSMSRFDQCNSAAAKGTKHLFGPGCQMWVHGAMNVSLNGMTDSNHPRRGSQSLWPKGCTARALSGSCMATQGVNLYSDLEIFIGPI